MRVLELNKQNVGLSRAEAEAYAHQRGELLGHHLILDTEETLIDVLAFTRSVGELIFRGADVPSVEALQAHLGPSYRLTFCDVPSALKRSLLALTKHLKGRVDLDDAETNLVFVWHEPSETLMCIKDPINNAQDFASRKAHLRPALHPSSLDPRLARAMVNLTGIPPGGTLVDPFCGSGGILIEAGLRGLEVQGSDISSPMIARCEENLAHYDVKGKVAVADALGSDGPFAFIATDLPYGKNTKTSKDLINRFLKSLPCILEHTAVVGLHSGIDVDALISSVNGLRLVHRFEIYLHKSLSKIIVVLKKE